MRGKLLFVAGAATGYVLGARAGRKRYEQIAAAATKVWETPGVQKQVNAVEDFAAAKFGELPGVVVIATKKVIEQLVNGTKSARSSAKPKGGAKPKSVAAKTTTAKTTAAKTTTAKSATAKATTPKATATKAATAEQPDS